MKRIILILALLFGASELRAADIYFAQASAGLNNGSSCVNARAVSSMAAGDYTAGNVLHLCGTLTAGFSILGSGSSGNVITIKWEASARISVTFGSMININGAKSFLLFDGGFACGPGTNCNAVENANFTTYAAGQTGIIEATANGSALANQNTATTAFNGCDGCHDIEIRNLIIRNLYQHTLFTDNTSGADSGNWAWSCWSGSTNGCQSGTISIHDSFIHDTGNAIQIQKNTSNTAKIFNIDFARNNWALDYSGNGTRTLFFHDLTCRDATNWDSSLDTYHHNCIHAFMNTSSDSLGTYVYNIRSTGDWGPCCTTATLLFVEVAPPSVLNVFNNLVIQSCNNNTAPGTQTRTQNAGAGGTYYNNTFLGCATTSANVEAMELNGTSGVSSENNAVEGYGQYVTSAAGNFSYATVDFNTYGAIGISGNNPWQCGATGATTFALWKSNCGVDTNGQKVSSININGSTGVPNVGSPLINFGTNLTSIATGNLAPLAFDINGSPRPAVGNWTAGAVNANPAGTSGGLGGTAAIGGTGGF